MNDLFQPAMALTVQIKDAQREHFMAVLNLAEAQRELDLCKARVEWDHILGTLRGDEKLLGPNEAARARTLTLVLGMSEQYQDELRRYVNAQTVERDTLAQFEMLKNQLRVYINLGKDGGE